jgi:hypothetical protein
LKASEEDVCGLLACLEQATCPALQELDMSRASCRGDFATRCLSQGLTGCPDLRRLSLLLEDPSTLLGLASALQQGMYPKLEALSTRMVSFALDEGEVFAAALQAFPRPGLRELDLYITTLGAGLVGVLQSGGCRGLTRLFLKVWSIGAGIGVAELVEAFGACLHLRTLIVDVTYGGDSVYRALAEVIRDGGLPGLEQFALFIKEVDDNSATALAEALEATAASGTPLRFEDYKARRRAEEEFLARCKARGNPVPRS